MFRANFDGIRETLETSLKAIENRFAEAINAQTALLESVASLAFERTFELNQAIPELRTKADEFSAALILQRGSITALEARLAKLEAKVGAA